MNGKFKVDPERVYFMSIRIWSGNLQSFSETKPDLLCINKPKNNIKLTCLRSLNLHKIQLRSNLLDFGTPWNVMSFTFQVSHRKISHIIRFLNKLMLSRCSVRWYCYVTILSSSRLLDTSFLNKILLDYVFK